MRQKPTKLLSTGLSIHPEIWGVGLAMLLGGLLRALYLLRSDFPMNDGGLFYSMAQDLVANQFALPQVTSYNFLNIPFAYPPLAIYLAAGLNRLLGIGLADLLRILPFTFSLLSIPLAYSIIRRLTGSSFQAGLAAIIYAILRPGFEWFIYGGGLTRASGWLFALAALDRALAWLESGRRRDALAVPACLALSAACHLEMGWFGAFSLAVLLWFKARNRRGLALFVGSGLVSFLLLAPYWITVVGRYGLEVLGRALQTGGFSWLIPPLKFVYFNFTGEGIFPLAAGLALLGLVACLVSRRFVLPVWLLAVVVLDGRTIDRSSSLAIAGLAAAGIDQMLRPALRLLASGEPDAKPAEGRLRAETVAAPLIVFFLLIGALLEPYLGKPWIPVLTASEREAMEWSGRSTPAGSRFLVVSSAVAWHSDAPAEWFPALARRQSVLTVQGSEWLPDRAVSRKEAEYAALHTCLNQGVTCLKTWLAEHQGQFDYVFYEKSLGGDFLEILRAAQYKPMFENDTTLILNR